ncbi:hypothetical protein SAMN06298216_3044 [Spirosomataceae bacterium TFI 002]|nr:hypothetical protein SAMN06298216_3044 [Spirosomataceae bacterium TFI 002]
MKTTILLLLLSFSGIAQITITGANEYPLINGTYSVSTYSYSNYWATIGSQDVGTFVYSHPGPSGSYIGFTIVRKQNHWYIEQEGDGNVRLLYKSVSPSASVVPDCNTQWEVWTGMWYDYGIVPSNTGNIETLAITGSCFCDEVLSTTVNPTNIELAIVNEPNTLPVPSPKKGMITYSSSKNIPMVYNGAIWEKVVLNRDTQFDGDLNLNGTLQIGENEKIIFNKSTNYAAKTITHGPDNIKFNLINGNLTIKDNGQFIFDSGQAYGNSTFSFGGSTDFPVATQNGGMWGNRGHTFVFTGTSPLSLYIPVANTAIGRHLYILNHGTQIITLTEPYKVNYNLSTSTIPVDTSVHLVSDGTDWHVIN